MKSCPPDGNHHEITLPGELDFRVLQERSALGIPIDARTWDQVCECAATLGVAWSKRFGIKLKAPRLGCGVKVSESIGDVHGKLKKVC